MTKMLGVIGNYFLCKLLTSQIAVAGERGYFQKTKSASSTCRFPFLDHTAVVVLPSCGVWSSGESVCVCVSV